MKRQTLAMADDQNERYARYGKPTRCDVFLATMEKIVPCAELCAVIEPHYPKPVNGRPPVGLGRMVRMHLVQQWFHLADAACEDALFDSTALRRFVGIDLGCERVSDATTLLKFRRLLETHKLGQVLFAKLGQVIARSGLRARHGHDRGCHDPRRAQFHKEQGQKAAIPRCARCARASSTTSAPISEEDRDGYRNKATLGGIPVDS